MSFLVINRELILKLKRFSVELVTFSFGGPDIYAREIIRHPGAVVILAINSNQRVILVRQARVALELETLEVPAGTITLGEIPLETAKRELAEEAGFQAADWISLGHIYPAPGICNEKQYLFLAQNLSPFRLEPDADERIEVLSLTFAEIRQMIANGDITDSKTIAILYKAEMLGLLQNNVRP